MYIIDNDGLANSDKRFPTKLRNNRNGWLHDEISGWVSTDGEEMPGILEERWLKFDDESSNGTQWMDERGVTIEARKGGLIPIKTILDDRHWMLLPEYYLRSWQSDQVTHPIYQDYQAKGVPCQELFKVNGGNSGLTEEFLYSLLNHQEEKRYLLLTGSTDPCTQIYIHRCNDPKNANRLIKVVSDEGIHIVRKGKAGHVNYLPLGDYAITDDAYILTKRANLDYDVSLEWVALTQKELFREFASSSDNGTWNKTSFLTHGTIDIPVLEEQQRVLEDQCR